MVHSRHACLPIAIATPVQASLRRIFAGYLIHFHRAARYSKRRGSRTLSRRPFVSMATREGGHPSRIEQASQVDCRWSPASAGDPSGLGGSLLPRVALLISEVSSASTSAIPSVGRVSRGNALLLKPRTSAAAPSTALIPVFNLHQRIPPWSPFIIGRASFQGSDVLINAGEISDAGLPQFDGF